MRAETPIIIANGIVENVFAYVNPTLYMGVAAFPVNTLVIGNGATVASPAAKQISFTNASGADNAAGNLTITAPLSTGAAKPASLILSIGGVAGSSAVVQSAIPLLSLTSGGTVFSSDLAPTGAAAVFETSTRGMLAYSGSLVIQDRANPPSLFLTRYDGTVTVPTAVVLNDILGEINVGGYDGAAFSFATRGRFRFVAAENWTATAQGTYWQLRVTPNGTTTNTTALRVENTGQLILTPTVANSSVLTSTGYSLTGSNATTMVGLAGTWNTSGTPTALSVAITNTASNAGSLLYNFLAGADGVTSMASLTVAGAQTIASSYTSGAPNGGTAAAWKFGTVAVVSPTAPNRTIEVDVGGTIYYLAAKTTNN